MDELVRLRAFQSAPVPAHAARAQAAVALRQAIGGQRRRPGRPVLAMVSAAIAAALATGAYAIYETVIVGTPASSSVKQWERRLGELEGLLIPEARRNPGLDIANTKAAAVIRTSVGPVYLWATTDNRGDACAFLEVVALDFPGGRPNLSGGCSSAGDYVYVGIHHLGVHHHPFALLQGRVGTPGATSVEVEFANGKSQTVAQSSKYVLAETDAANVIRKVIVRDAGGRIIATRRTPKGHSATGQDLVNPQSLQSQIATSSLHTIVSLKVIGGQQRLTESGDSSRRCRQLRIARVQGSPERGIVISGCNNRPIGPPGLDIGPGQIGAAPQGLLLLWGPVGTAIDSLELRFEDGSHVAIAIHDGYILYQINPRNYRSGHRPMELLARDAPGHIVNVRKFGFLR